MLHTMIWIVRSGAPWRELPERYGPWKTVYSRFRKQINDGLEHIFRILSLEAELEKLSLDASIVKSHPYSAGKKGPPNETGYSRGGARTKIHAVPDAYEYPVYIRISEGQCNDINFCNTDTGTR